MRKPVVDQNQRRLTRARGRAAAVALTVTVGMVATAVSAAPASAGTGRGASGRPMLLVTDAGSPSAAVVDPDRRVVTGRFPLHTTASPSRSVTSR
jgi:hypothetical protein